MPLTGFFIFAFGLLLSVLVGFAGAVNMALGMSSDTGRGRADGMFQRHALLMIPAALAGLVSTVGLLWFVYDLLVWATVTG